MINEPGYRLNVGIIIINDKGKLLLCKRKNIDSWQFPQGGIDEGESPIKHLSENFLKRWELKVTILSYYLQQRTG